MPKAKPTFSEFKRAYLKAESEFVEILLNQIQECEPCKVVDYAYCLKRCKVLKENLDKAKKHSDFFWIAKKVVYQILQFVKAETFCKAYGIEDEQIQTEFSVPKLEELPPEDKPVIDKLVQFFATECKTCQLPVGKSCFECQKVRELQKELKTRLGRKAFAFFLTLNADVKRERKREKEIRFFYERIYEPPVKVDWSPKDPWGFFFWKVLERKDS